jgi:hypothetical protein
VVDVESHSADGSRLYGYIMLRICERAVSMRQSDIDGCNETEYNVLLPAYLLSVLSCVGIVT